MKISAIQSSGAYQVAASLKWGREAPEAAGKKVGGDPAPILTAMPDAGAAEVAKAKKDATMERMVDAANQALSHTNRHVQVERHDPTNRFVLKLVDQDSGDIVRQYPAESFLKVSEQLAELRGMLFASEG